MSTLPSQTDPERLQALRDRLAAHQDLLPELADQLRAVVQQTEQAVLEISEKFMNIAGRARRQLQATTDLVVGLEQKQRTAAGPDAGLSAKTETPALDLETLSTEAELLGTDINGIITALQFQDITRQQIEKAIVRIEQFQQELSDMKRDLESGKAPARGPEKPGAESTRREHA